MNNEDRETPRAAHYSGWRTFEALFVPPFLVALLLQWVVPLRLPWGDLNALLPVGLVLVTLGVALVVLGRRELALHQQPTDPGHPTGKIVTTGVFGISRNPLYLGGACVLAGIALAFSLAWALIFMPVSLLACHYLLIKPEERYLTEQFGDTYRDYTATVHRWIGRRVF